MELQRLLQLKEAEYVENLRSSTAEVANLSTTILDLQQAYRYFCWFTCNYFCCLCLFFQHGFVSTRESETRQVLFNSVTKWWCCLFKWTEVFGWPLFVDIGIINFETTLSATFTWESIIGATSIIVDVQRSHIICSIAWVFWVRSAAVSATYRSPWVAGFHFAWCSARRAGSKLFVWETMQLVQEKRTGTSAFAGPQQLCIWSRLFAQARSFRNQSFSNSLYTNNLRLQHSCILHGFAWSFCDTRYCSGPTVLSLFRKLFAVKIFYFLSRPGS